MSESYGPEMLEPDEEVFLKAVCCDTQCQATIYLTSRASTVECFHCGQQHERRALQNVQELDERNGLDSVLEYTLIMGCLPKRGPDMVKVLGLSNYFCKLLSPFLTTYGMEKSTRKPKLLKDMGRGDIFDCSPLSSRAYLIDPQHISIPGFGRDVTGSMDYLSETLQLIKHSNGGEERLLPIYADGDGHCLVHAISRALVGRELFWHPLRSSLKRLFENNLEKFKELFENFIGTDEWQTIIDECDPDFQPPEGDFHGLRNIHIFGLANVLRRPIILLDSWECMNKSGDYSGVFLPGFVPPSECRGEDNTLNKPICIAWSSKSHNHYIPLVGILNMPLPVLPRSLIPSVFRMSQSEISSYIEFDENDNCIIGGSRTLSENYLQCLVFAMETQFTNVHGIHPSLVADAKHFFYSNNVYLNTSPIAVMRQVRNVCNEGLLFRCSTCTALCEMHVDHTMFQFGGYFYDLLKKNHRSLVNGSVYAITLRNGDYIFCNYDSRNDVLIPDLKSCQLAKCHCCKSPTVKKIEPYIKQELDTNNKSSISRVEKSDEAENKTTVDIQLPRIKVQWKDTTVEDVIPDCKNINEESFTEVAEMITLSFIKKHFAEEMDNKLLQTCVYQEILKTVGKAPSAASSSSKSTSIPKEESKTEKLLLPTTEDIGDSNNFKSEPSTSQTQAVKLVSNSGHQLASPTSEIVEVSNKIKSEPSTSQMQTVKLVSISGHQVTLDINDKGVSYGQLQETIKKEFGIPFPNQRIKLGFPPKLLEPPHSNEGQALSLKHGDRLIVENCSVQETKRFASTPYIRNNASWNRPTECHSELWKTSKLQPHLFKKGGQYFEEANMKHILYDLVHVAIDSFPSKMFSYNAINNSLELCVKPYGHFEICIDMDGRIEQVMKGELVRGFRNCPIMSLKPGRKDIKPNKIIDHNPSTTNENIVTPQTSADVGRLRKGPGFSVLTSPKPSNMDLS